MMFAGKHPAKLGRYLGDVLQSGNLAHIRIVRSKLWKGSGGRPSMSALGAVSLSQIKSEHIDDGDRPGLAVPGCVRLVGRHVPSARPCLRTDECALRCSIPCRIGEHAAGVAPRPPRCGRGISADRADQSLRMPVLPWRPRRDRLITDAQKSHATDEHLAVAGIPIANQMVGCWLPATGLRELMASHSAVGGCAVTPSHRICRRLCLMINSP